MRGDSVQHQGMTIRSPLAASALAAVLLAAPLTDAGAAWTETVLYDFGTGKPTPLGAPVADAAGNIYGVTSLYGVQSAAIFRLSPPPSGQGRWIETTLYRFTPNDGVLHVNPGLAIDSAGNLYGTSAGDTAANLGAVFELQAPTSSATKWTLHVLHAFTPTSDNAPSYPTSAPVIDGAGNLYGTTKQGGVADALSIGTAFELSPPTGSNGQWVFKVIYQFDKDVPIGQLPSGALALDANGDLYGNVTSGATVEYGAGGVYELTPPPSGRGSWKATQIWYFNDVDGQNAYYGLTFDGDGTLYGATFNGGVDTDGDVFALTPPASAGGAWKPVVLSASFNTATGKNPVGNLAIDPAGNLYGALSDGASPSCPFGCGSIYRLGKPASGHAWQRDILYRFNSRAGGNPAGGVIIDTAGDLYGFTQYEGNLTGHGTFYRLSPSGQP